MNSNKNKKTKFSFIEISIVISQFVIILLHFIKFTSFNKILIRESIKSFSPIGNFIIIIGIVLILIAIKDLGRSTSPMPMPKDNSKLVTTGIYSLFVHPMYYSLIIISVGFLIKSFTIYNLILTILLTILLFMKIQIEEKYLCKRYESYSYYKKKVKL
tara:strand:- start:1124 stop:1597 length:474 start_codon:yes stop_codon:yes gene_type:complete